ncbi:MAG TPA: sugar transferase [Candidatus Limnocylindrales bacterium]|nr:sugar transferase [Candidatus Limnocylindrales bacterium]
MSEYLVSPYQHSLEKRMLDVSFAGSIGLIALTAGAMTAAGIAVSERMSPFFVQRRQGRGGTDFSVLKLRTMRKDGSLIRGGKAIRSSGVDETPQFLNILNGNMSVVGYRPLLTEDINHAANRLKAHYTESSPYHPNRWLTLRDQCNPGITGPSQTMQLREDAGSLTHLADVIAQECAYMEQGTFATDLRFIVQTPGTLQHGHNLTVTRAS